MLASQIFRAKAVRLAKRTETPITCGDAPEISGAAVSAESCVGCGRSSYESSPCKRDWDLNAASEESDSEALLAEKRTCQAERDQG